MSDAARPLITTAKEIKVPSERHVWNLHTADGSLIGWTNELPSALVTSPGCWQYGTGDHLAVDYSPQLSRQPLPRR